MVIVSVIIGIVSLKTIKAAKEIEQVVIPEREPETVTVTSVPIVTPHPVFDHATTGGLGPEIFDESEYPGKVVTVEYPTIDYPSGYGSCIKAMRVYLPNGYSESTKYNVLILLHGSGGRETYWFDEPRWYNDPDYLNCYECHLATLLDNMAANNLCEPVIVVSPTFYFSNSWRMSGDDTSRDAYQFREELRNDILPKLASVYSVYDVGDRDHYGFIGASHGAEVGYNSVFPDCLDLFSWFGMISGGELYQYSVESKWNTKHFENLNINFLYSSAGETDYTAEDSYSAYKQLLLNSSKINEDNSEYVVIRNSGHEDVVWIDGVYNCLLRFFKVG